MPGEARKLQLTAFVTGPRSNPEADGEQVHLDVQVAREPAGPDGGPSDGRRIVPTGPGPGPPGP